MKGITMRQFTRRQTLKNVTAMTAVTFLGTLGVPRRAAAGTEITAVEWGGDVVNARVRESCSLPPLTRSSSA